MLKDMLAIAWQPRTYLRISYLLLAFPLGTFYFVFLLSLISVGVGTALVAGIGIGLLLVAVACWFGFAGLERILAVHLLGVTVLPMSVPGPPTASYRERLRRHLTNPVTWKSLGYLLLELPFGILSFSLVVILIPLCAGFLLYPLAYLLDNYIYNRVGGYQGEIFPGIAINGHSDPNVFAFLFLFTLAGVPVLVGSLHLLNGLGYAWGRFAQLMLGVDEQPVPAVGGGNPGNRRAGPGRQRRPEPPRAGRQRLPRAADPGRQPPRPPRLAQQPSPEAAPRPGSKRIRCDHGRRGPAPVVARRRRTLAGTRGLR